MNQKLLLWLSCLRSSSDRAAEEPVRKVELPRFDIKIPAGRAAGGSESSVWGTKWLSRDRRALLPSVSWPKQVDNSSSRSPAPSRTSGLTGPRDGGGPLVCICSIFTTATFPCASACTQKKQTLKKQITHRLFFFSVAFCSRSHFIALSRGSDVETEPNKMKMWPKWQWSYLIELHGAEHWDYNTQ